ncbi:SDR family oxidoreductase [Dasania sp. GY-MA-18]|uniref:SDR family oxidoreductase n=1 Tax=Dasania phycosphaerae TaxID=2950436 RepID=A0A9J6RMP0_9GAMM|nr:MULTISPECIES: SDR family oxidoreductase [Dasania]MCR8923008.1 SDR family oxidoreductase [Dasania sp. GY-MA-18]MCZ0865439.1 SDR family oxidoreductase [Dasania phycosphaerae]MCZ0869164.1 SDR family oxidoreductase [Dasania phycosphaerae]
MEVHNKTILLVGATGGIGAAIAKQLDQLNAHLLLVGRSEQALRQLSAGLSHRHILLLADINSAAGRQQIVTQCQQQAIDIYINAAGVMDFQLLAQQESVKIEQMINTNLLSPMMLCQLLLPLLTQKSSAAIVNIGSTFGSIGHPGFAVYCASKFGLRGFSEALRRELAGSGVQVLYFSPRATRTALNTHAVKQLNEALGNRSDSPEQVAKMLIASLKANNGQQFMGWPEKIFVRLNALCPNLVHKALVKKLPIIFRYANENTG